MVKKDWKPTERAYLCSEHFQEEDFEKFSPFRVNLKLGTVPSISKELPRDLQKDLDQNIKKETEDTSGMESTVPTKSEAVEPVEIKAEALEEVSSSSNSKDEPTVEKILDNDNPTIKLKIKIEPTKDGLTELSVEPSEIDIDGEEVIMSPEEVRKYLDNKIKEYLHDAEANKLMKLYKRSLELREVLKEKNDEFLKIQKLIEMIFRNQEKFLRQSGIIPKIPTYNRGIQVDLPTILASESLKTPKLYESNAAKQANKTPLQPLNKNGASSKPTSNSSSASKESIECIDLTDDSDCSDKSKTGAQPIHNRLVSHPAPFPPRPSYASNDNFLKVPPRPRLKVHCDKQGIVLQWDMPPIFNPDKYHAKIIAYDIFGYQVLPAETICTLLWKKIGSVKAMTLPMACTLTQFVEGQKYFFAIRAIDQYNRCSSFSEALSIIYAIKKDDGSKK